MSRGGVACESENRQSAIALYRDVVNDVIENIKTAFLEEGLDESLVRELQQAPPSNLDDFRPHRCFNGRCTQWTGFAALGDPPRPHRRRRGLRLGSDGRICSTAFQPPTILTDYGASTTAGKE